MDKLERSAEKMELILMLHEPGSAAAADAYDGLRKQVTATVTDHIAHLAQLVQFEAAIRHGADLELLKKMVAGWCESSGLEIVGYPETLDAQFLFELVDDQGGELEVIDPAYVERSSGRVIRFGRARRAAFEAPSDAPLTGDPPAPKAAPLSEPDYVDYEQLNTDSEDPSLHMPAEPASPNGVTE